MEPEVLEQRLSDRLRGRTSLLLEIVLIFWIVELVNAVLGHQLCGLGIRPRRLIGLLGIPLHPFLHVGLAHLAVNTIPFIVLGWLVIARGKRQFLELSLFIILVGGAGIWVFGRSNSLHVGASGLVFGYFGFLVARGWYEWTLRSVAIALLVLVLYGSLLLTALPTARDISWEGHLFGLIAGVIAAKLEFARAPAKVKPCRRDSTQDLEGKRLVRDAPPKKETGIDKELAALVRERDAGGSNGAS